MALLLIDWLIDWCFTSLLILFQSYHGDSSQIYVFPGFNPLPDDKFQTSKLKDFADDNFKFDENSRKLSKWVENTVGKGEMARHEQFLLFPQCFQKACFPGASKGVIVWEWVNQYQTDVTKWHGQYCNFTY